jgi:hypothetical protein
MAITYSSQIQNLYAGSVATETAYQAPGDYGFTSAQISSTAERRILTLIEVIRSYFASVSVAEEAAVARDVLFRMMARCNTGGTFSASTIATAMQKAGVVQFDKRLRSQF